MMVLLVFAKPDASEHVCAGRSHSHREAGVQVLAGNAAYSVGSEQLTHDSLPRNDSPGS
jgi:hypothetical protein